MFGRKNKVIEHGVLYGFKGMYVQTCRTCGCVYANRRENVTMRVSSLSGKRYLDTKCPECGAANSEEITEALHQAQERAED